MLRDKLSKKEFVITMEVDPPRGADPWPVYEQIADLAPLLTAVNIADCPTAKLRMSPIALAHLIQANLELESIFHLTCRDRNIIGLQAELLGAHAMGVKNILALTGDHPSLGDHKEAGAVYDVNSVGLARMAQMLNAGTDVNQQPIHGNTDFFVGAVCNPASPNLQFEKQRMAEKTSNGVQFFQTQPIYSVEQYYEFQEVVQPTVPVIYGLMPLKSVKQANYLNAKVPGVKVPDEMIAVLESSGPEAALEKLMEMALVLKKEISGVHLFPMGKYETIVPLVEALR